MSAELLREAAAAIRKEQDVAESLGHIGHREYAAWMAVAAWLGACAFVVEVKPDATRAHALTVARAYLNKPTPP